MSVREWVVAGGLIEAPVGLLLVRNKRRGGFSDWSTPGGVIDHADRSTLDGLTREVSEETGISVTEWEGPLYAVEAVAPDLGWALRAEVYRAVVFGGELCVNDPDGIVVDAAFWPLRHVPALLASGARWVREPLADWLAERWGPGNPRSYRYEVWGTSWETLRVERTGG
jgi:ADP-ribose pyrophosphatase YjhB (NUDIX family)